MKPWDIQKRNDKPDVLIPSVTKMIEIIESINNPMAQALIGLTYLTGGRISELIRGNEKKYGREMPGIKRKQIDLDNVDGHKTLKIQLRNLKKRDNKEAYKIIPVPLDIESNKKIVGLIWNYIKQFEPDEEIFTIKYTRAREIILKYTEWNAHWIRHIRTNHLLTHYNFKEELVRVHMGWKDLRPLSRYSGLKWRDIVKGYYD